MNTQTKKQLTFTILIGIFSFAYVAFAFYIKHKFSSSPWDGTIYNLSAVNFLDRILAHPFNQKIHRLGDILCVTNLTLLPLAFLIYSVLKSENKVQTLFTVGCVYIITFFFTKGTYDLLKSLVERTRPYMYFPNPCEEALTNGDFQHSWPSGHTTNAFMAIGFVTAGLILLKDKTKAKNIFIITGYAISLATAICRILSGNHFLTDVLSGMLIGSIIGYGIPLLINKCGIKFRMEQK